MFSFFLLSSLPFFFFTIKIYITCVIKVEKKTELWGVAPLISSPTKPQEGFPDSRARSKWPVASQVGGAILMTGASGMVMGWLALEQVDPVKR